MTALAIYDNGRFDVMQRTARALAESGYFSDSRNIAQAVVKVMAGAELGLPPFASMTGIHIIQGKPALGANVIATLIKNDPRYNYRVMEHTDTVCRIEFYEDGTACGVSEFTAADAKKAGTKNMDRFPKNMLFARAISNGARWYTPGIFGGSPVYTPDELGADVDEDGYIIDVTPQPAPTVVEQKPQPQPVNGNGNGNKYARPMAAETVREVMQKKVANGSTEAASDKQRQYAVANLSAVTTGNDERYMITEYLFGVTSSKDLTRAQASAIIDWIGYKEVDGEWVFSEDARQEAARIVAQQRVASGQGMLFPDASNGAYEA